VLPEIGILSGRQVILRTIFCQNITGLVEILRAVGTLADDKVIFVVPGSLIQHIASSVKTVYNMR
jgi:hypothetical protein